MFKLKAGWSLNLTKIKKLPGRFYRWTTYEIFWGIFKKMLAFWGLGPMPQFSQFFFS